ncbi:hypothetical protein DOL97_21810 [Salmonella enterica subsp. enterica serovar Derby]|nr:hypothetical protein DOL97_21810 [Salmonella enterica subsp. enterica serovar Derby]
MLPLPLKLPDIATPSIRRSIYLPRCMPFLAESVNIYLQDKPYHKLTSDLIPYANFIFRDRCDIYVV